MGKIRIALAGAGMTFDVSWAMNLEEADGYLTDNQPRVPPVNPYEAETDHFLSCLKAGTSPDPGLGDGVTLMRMLSGIYQSAKEGREVSL